MPLDSFYALFYLRAVIDVDVAGKAVIGPFIYLYDCVKEFRDAAAVTGNRGADGHTKEVAKLGSVQFIPLMLKFVVHIEGHHNPKVHVYELGSEVEVTLNV